MKKPRLQAQPRPALRRATRTSLAGLKIYAPDVPPATIPIAAFSALIR